LILDGDGTDSRNYSREQTRLRLEAFLEMLEARP
jgi:benzoyl-CoA reductase/2-hydroxyglutaryl-CoA dehydratase subunit BcrC/BadD/HgdB